MITRSRLAKGLAITIALDTAAQMVWKYAAMQLPQAVSLWSVVCAALSQPYFYLVATLFILQLVNWLGVLEHADISYAQPITSLSYATVAIASVLLYGEALGPRKTIGILLILAGTWYISRSKPLTELTS